jgi:hypothetical protein
MATGGSSRGSGRRHFRRQWWQAATVVTAGYGEEGKSRVDVNYRTILLLRRHYLSHIFFARRREGQTALYGLRKVLLCTLRL